MLGRLTDIFARGFESSTLKHQLDEANKYMQVLRSMVDVRHLILTH